MQKKKKKFFIFLGFVFSLFLFTGCCYRLVGKSEEGLALTKIAIPYIEGDLDGKLTEALIKALSKSPQLEYSKKHEALVFEGKIIENSLEYFGYQYDREPLSNERKNRLIPNEGTRVMALSFSLIEAKTCKVLLGPIHVSADQDFDFVDSDSLLDNFYINPNGNLEPVLFFSLGQLDTKEGAKNGALFPLYEKLSDKVIEGIEQAFFHLKPSS